MHATRHIKPCAVETIQWMKWQQFIELNLLLQSFDQQIRVAAILIILKPGLFISASYEDQPEKQAC